MSDIETGLRAMVSALVREEVERALADARKTDEYLTTEDAARLANVNPATIRRWVQAKTLSRHSAGRVLRVSRLELERWIRDGIPANGERELTPEQHAAKRLG